MITKFKLFENVSQPPKIGDYVIIDYTGFVQASGDKQLYDFYLNNVGKVIGGNNEDHQYQWEKVPIFTDRFRKDYFKNNIREYHGSWFMCWSDDKEELEAYLTAKKYNL
jgi:hypothetical protein